MIRRWWILSILLVFALPLAPLSCKSSGGHASDEPLTSERPDVPRFFDEIPEDSFYVFTGVDPFPRDVVEATLARAGDPITDDYLSMLQKGVDQGHEFAGLVLAAAREFQGRLNPEGLEEIGVDLAPHFALYGVGGVPVLQLELRDAKSFEATVERIVEDSGLEVEKRKRQGVDYRIYREGESMVVVTVRDGRLVASAGDDEAVTMILPYVLGTKKPDKSLADRRRIRALIGEYDYESFGVGYVDVRGLVETLTGLEKPGTPTRSVLKAIDADIDEPSEACRTEIGKLADATPRSVFGIRELTPREFELHGGLEIETGVAEELRATVEAIPGLDSDIFRRAALSFGFGIDVTALVETTRRHARRILDEPYQCGDLQYLNDWAKRVDNRPIPPVVQKLRGGALILDSVNFDAGGFIPRNIEALALVKMDNPQALIGRMKPVVPGMMKLELKDDGVPVALTQLGKMVQFLNTPHIALDGDSVGFSAGTGMQDEMAAVLEKPSVDTTNRAMSISYDLAKLQRSMPPQGRQALDRLMGESFDLALSGSSVIDVLFEKTGVFFTLESEFPPADSNAEKTARN